MWLAALAAASHAAAAPAYLPATPAADSGIPLDCGYFGPPIAEACKPNETHPGLWVVPQYQMQCGEGCYYGIAGAWGGKDGERDAGGAER